ncbi:hypothetical protein CKO44_15940 [Rubrivivax gelatinosus]|uniref:DUF3486 family protein n=1 Tax=Rubrivivax gelatinosus TaxID=28068 RepID=UPI00190788C4|nr:DUF3486 family protein [Rubrivivax gelatinosus]MBK1614960.1 hypothetical protein [Rubrivivax gelatinosus]
MGRKSTLDRLPTEIKAYIQAALATGAQTLDELIADLRERFPAAAGAGVLPSRSAVGRYGQKLDRRLSAIKASTEAAVMISQHAGDDKDARSEALTSLVQTGLMEAFISLQEADDPDVDPAERIAMLSSAAKNIATLTRSSVNLKKFQAEVEASVRAKQLEEQNARLTEVAKAQGMDEAQADFWRRKVLGIG